MKNPLVERTSAQQLAALVRGTAKTEWIGQSIQRSHRFPIHIFGQIENMAKMSNHSVSTVIDLLLEAGLESVKKELPPELIEQVQILSEEQVNRKPKPKKP